MKRSIWSVAFLAAVLLVFSACDDSDEEEGVCLAFSSPTQCYDCWEKSDCDGVSGDWISEESSCSDAGYSIYFGNNCGYSNQVIDW